MARKRKPKMLKAAKGGGRRMAKAELTMAPTRGVDPSKSTAPKLAAAGSKPRRPKGAGYRQRMDALEL